MKFRTAKYAIGQVVKHRVYPFRGVIFDVDPTFSNTEEWYIDSRGCEAVKRPALLSFARGEFRGRIHRLCVGAKFVPDTSRDPVRHPQVQEIFKRGRDGAYRMKAASLN